MATTIASLPTFLVRHKEKLGIAVEDGIVETFRRVKGSKGKDSDSRLS